HSWKTPCAGWKLPAYQLGAAGGRGLPFGPIPDEAFNKGSPPGPYWTPPNTWFAQLPCEAQSVTALKASSRYWKPVAMAILPAQVESGSPLMLKSTTSWRWSTICQGSRPSSPLL